MVGERREPFDEDACAASSCRVSRQPRPTSVIAASHVASYGKSKPLAASSASRSARFVDAAELAEHER